MYKCPVSVAQLEERLTYSRTFLPIMHVSIQSRTQSYACSRIRVGIGSGETEWDSKFH